MAVGNWYSVNRLSVTNGETQVTGNGTAFATYVHPGFGIAIEGHIYEIASIQSDTVLTLAQEYEGTTKADARYSIFPTEGLNYPVWQKSMEMIAEFAPLRNNMTVLIGYINDTESWKNSASASAIAAATSATNAATSAAAALADRILAGQHKDAAAASLVSTNAAKTAAETARDTTNGYKAAAQTSAENAATYAATTLADRNTTNGYKTDAQTAKAAAETARDTTITAKNDTLTAKGLVDTAKAETLILKGDVLTLKGLVETLKTDTEGYKNTAVSSAATATTKATEASGFRDTAETAKNTTVAARDEVLILKSDVTTLKNTTVSAKDTAVSARDQALIYRNEAQEAAAEATAVVTDNSILAALGYMPVSPSANNVFTGNNRMPNLTIGNTTGPYLYSDSDNYIVRVGAGGTAKYLSFNAAGELLMNGSKFYHENFNPTKAAVGLGNVDNTSDANKPVSSATQTALNLKANIAAPTFTGNVTVPSLDVNGGDILISRTSNSTGYIVRPNSAGNKNLAVAVVGGGNLDNFGIYSNNTTAMGLITAQSTGTNAGLRMYNTTGGRDYRVVQKDAGHFAITDETAGAERLTINAAGTLSLNGPTIITGTAYLQTNPELRTSSPTIYLRHSAGNKSAMIHNNANTLYFLRGETDTTTWTQVDGVWPLQIDLNDNTSRFGGNMFLTRNGSNSVQLQLSSPNATYQYVRFATNNSPRWDVGSANGTENGGNAGSDFFISSFDDSGNFLRQPLSISRITGWTTLNHGATVNGGLTVSGGINGRAYPRRSDGQDMNLIWNDPGGRKNYIVGSDDGNNFYVTHKSNYIARTNAAGENAAYSRGLVLAGHDATADIWSSPIELREVNYVGNGNNNSTHWPGILFHHQSVAAAGIKMANDGSIRHIAQGGGYANTFQNNLYAADWIRPMGAAGIHWDAYGHGITTSYMNATYGNISTYGTGRNGWTGYSIQDSMCMMTNLVDLCGIHSNAQGRWLVNWDNGGNATFPANITAYSDERLKQNMRPIDNAEARLKGMAEAAIMYERDGQTRIGFGAQTLEKSNPELVFTATDLVGTKSVNYGDSVGLLAVMTQKQADRIEVLEAENAALKSTLEDVLKRLEKAGL